MEYESADRDAMRLGTQSAEGFNITAIPNLILASSITSLLSLPRPLKEAKTSMKLLAINFSGVT